MPGEARGERVESPGQEAAAHSPRSGVMFERAADQEIGGAQAVSSNGVVYPGRHGWRGGVCSRSPRARAQGLLWGRGWGCPCYRAGLASKRRQDAEAQLAWSERRQDAGANVRRDGTGNPDPLEEVASSATATALQATERQDAEAWLAWSERGLGAWRGVQNVTTRPSAGASGAAGAAACSATSSSKNAASRPRWSRPVRSRKFASNRNPCRVRIDSG